MRRSLAISLGLTLLAGCSGSEPQQIGAPQPASAQATQTNPDKKNYVQPEELPAFLTTRS